MKNSTSSYLIFRNDQVEPNTLNQFRRYKTKLLLQIPFTYNKDKTRQLSSKPIIIRTDRTTEPQTQQTHTKNTEEREQRSELIQNCRIPQKTHNLTSLPAQHSPHTKTAPCNFKKSHSKLRIFPLSFHFSSNRNSLRNSKPTQYLPS